MRRAANAVRQVRSLAVAESPAKRDMLDLLDRVRKRVERDEVIALALAPIETGGQYTCATAGDLDGLQRIGLLMTMVHDVLEAGRGN